MMKVELEFAGKQVDPHGKTVRSAKGCFHEYGTSYKTFELSCALIVSFMRFRTLTVAATTHSRTLRTMEEAYISIAEGAERGSCEVKNCLCYIWCMEGIDSLLRRGVLFPHLSSEGR